FSSAIAAANEPLGPAHAEGKTTRVERKEGVPLTGERVDAAQGDFMIEGGGLVAVVSATRGRLADFGVEGGRDEVTGIDPSIYDGLSRMDAEVISIAATPDGHAI